MYALPLDHLQYQHAYWITSLRWNNSDCKARLFEDTGPQNIFENIFPSTVAYNQYRTFSYELICCIRFKMFEEPDPPDDWNGVEANQWRHKKVTYENDLNDDPYDAQCRQGRQPEIKRLLNIKSTLMISYNTRHWFRHISTLNPCKCFLKRETSLLGSFWSFLRIDRTFFWLKFSV